VDILPSGFSTTKENPAVNPEPHHYSFDEPSRDARSSDTNSSSRNDDMFTTNSPPDMCTDVFSDIHFTTASTVSTSGHVKTVNENDNHSQHHTHPEKTSDPSSSTQNYDHPPLHASLCDACAQASKNDELHGLEYQFHDSHSDHKPPEAYDKNDRASSRFMRSEWNRRQRECGHWNTFSCPLTLKQVKASTKRNVTQRFMGGVLDTGAQRTVIGLNQAQAYCRDQRIPLSLSKSWARFKFASHVTNALGSMVILLPTPKDTIRLHVDVVKDNIPLLIGMDSMDSNSL